MSSENEIDNKVRDHSLIMGKGTGRKLFLPLVRRNKHFRISCTHMNLPTPRTYEHMNTKKLEFMQQVAQESDLLM